EIRVAEVFVLDERRVSCVPQDTGDFNCNGGVLARPRDEEMTLRHADVRHGPVPAPRSMAYTLADHGRRRKTCEAMPSRQVRYKKRGVRGVSPRLGRRAGALLAQRGMSPVP